MSLPRVPGAPRVRAGARAIVTPDAPPAIAARGSAALRHLAVGAPEAPLLSQDLPCLAHGQSLGGHPSPLSGADGPADGPASLGFGHRPDHDPPIPVITMPIFLITIDRSW